MISSQQPLSLVAVRQPSYDTKYEVRIRITRVIERTADMH